MFKSRVKELMQEKGFTLRSLASSALVARKTIEKARTDAGIAECRLSTLKRIADCLGVPVKALFDEADKDATDDRTKKGRLGAYNALHGRSSDTEKKARVRNTRKGRLGYSGG